MTREEAIKWLQQIENAYIHGGDESFDESRKKALHMAIDALENTEYIINLQKTYQEFVDIWRKLEVVRCKDCDRGFGSPVCPIQSQGWAINKNTFYCAWGERSTASTDGDLRERSFSENKDAPYSKWYSHLYEERENNETNRR